MNDKGVHVEKPDNTYVSIVDVEKQDLVLGRNFLHLHTIPGVHISPEDSPYHTTDITLLVLFLIDNLNYNVHLNTAIQTMARPLTYTANLPLSIGELSSTLVIALRRVGTNSWGIHAQLCIKLVHQGLQLRTIVYLLQPEVRCRVGMGHHHSLHVLAVAWGADFSFFSYFCRWLVVLP